MKTKKQKIGTFGEKCAQSFLMKKGYKILTTNYFVRVGEVDIIATIDAVLCFIEVKTRSYNYASASRATNYKKINRIKNAAKMYLVQENISADSQPIRFEQVNVFLYKKKPYIKHHIIIID